MNRNYLFVARRLEPIWVQGSRVVAIRRSSTQREETREAKTSAASDKSGNEFPVLDLLPHGRVRRVWRTMFKNQQISPRYQRMTSDQDWGSAWPTARVFHPASVPLPLHMSYMDENKLKAPVSKWNNPELMKIPNFLHLTPPVVTRQCQALKRFCTPWPTELRTDEDCDRHFPVRVRTKDFLFSGPSLRWPEGRAVELSLPLDRLGLNERASDKLRRLVRHRYNRDTDRLTMRADACPVRKQNYDYAQYLLTAVYFESLKIEEWEVEKEYGDWERYFFEQSPSRTSIIDYRKKVMPTSTEAQVLADPKVTAYGEAVSRLYDQKESSQTLKDYKESVLGLMF